MSQLPAQVTEACFSVCRLPTCRASWHRLSFPTPYPVLSVEMMESLLSPLEEEWCCGSISDSELENLSKWVADTWDFVNQPFVVLLDPNKYPLLEAGVSDDCSGLKGEVKVKKNTEINLGCFFFFWTFVCCLFVRLIFNGVDRDHTFLASAFPQRTWPTCVYTWYYVQRNLWIDVVVVWMRMFLHRLWHFKLGLHIWRHCWESLGGMALLKEVCHWRWQGWEGGGITLRVQKTPNIPSLFSVSCMRFKL